PAPAAAAACPSPRGAKRVIDGFRWGPKPDAAAQEVIGSPRAREREVLALLGAGRANSEVAQQLYLPEGTVKGYVSSILTKLGAENRVQAAILAHRPGLVPTPKQQTSSWRAGMGQSPRAGASE